MLSQEKEQYLKMTLGMLHRDASTSGLLVYQKATAEYARRGHRIVEASFSAHNQAAHNIHAKRGVRFGDPGLCWFWIREDLAEGGWREK
jgi:hypothetical protein